LDRLEAAAPVDGEGEHSREDKSERVVRKDLLGTQWPGVAGRP
jgi:hypothetical protein